MAVLAGAQLSTWYQVGVFLLYVAGERLRAKGGKLGEKRHRGLILVSVLLSHSTEK